MTTATVTPHAEWLAALAERFGADPMDWAFVCPSCGDVATGRDFREALQANPATRRDGTPVMASDLLGRECIGRSLGALRRDVRYKGRGCDWAAYGLFSGPEFVLLSDGTKSPCFRMAPDPAGASSAVITTRYVPARGDHATCASCRTAAKWMVNGTTTCDRHRPTWERRAHESAAKAVAR